MSHDTAQLCKLPSYPTKPGAVSGGQGVPGDPPSPSRGSAKSNYLRDDTEATEGPVTQPLARARTGPFPRLRDTLVASP